MSAKEKEFKDKLLITSLLTFKFYEPLELLAYINYFKKCRKDSTIDQSQVEEVILQITAYILNQFHKELESFKASVNNLKETKKVNYFRIADDYGNQTMVRPLFVSLRRIQQAISIDEVRSQISKSILDEIEYLIGVVKSLTPNDMYLSEVSETKYFGHTNRQKEAGGFLIGIIILIIILLPLYIMFGGLLEKDDNSKYRSKTTIDCSDPEMSKYNKYCNGEAEYEDKMQEYLEDEQWNSVRPG